MYTVLTVDDNKKLTHLIQKNVGRHGYDVIAAHTIEEAVTVIESSSIDAVLLDLMLAEQDGLDGLGRFLGINNTIPIIILTGFATIESAVKAIKLGAYDYLQKPVEFNKLLTTIEKAIEYASLKYENKKLRSHILKTNGFFQTTSKKMLDVIEKAKSFAVTDLPVLITGESGTGKELLAEFIHENSPRSINKMIKVNSSSFPEGLLTNELFGHEKNSFTGAGALYKGVFEQATKSTLFLDEIGDMPLEVQAKILRTLQNNEIRRIGGTATISIDVRFITATNKVIPNLISENKFRDDLYFRINTAVLNLPPLRERKEDIPLLAEYFIFMNRSKPKTTEKELSMEVLGFFLEYSWPGNIRELKNVIDYVMAVSKSAVINPHNLPPYLFSETNPPIELKESSSGEQEKIEQILNETKYNKKKAAELLGISRKTLYNKLNKYGIK